MTSPAVTSLRDSMINTIAEFLHGAMSGNEERSAPRESAEKLTTLLLETVLSRAMIQHTLEARMVSTRSLHQLRKEQQHLAGVSRESAGGAEMSVPDWATCPDDHCRTVQHCVHGASAKQSTVTQLFAGLVTAD